MMLSKALFDAVHCGDTDEVKSLISSGSVNIHEVDSYRYMAQHHAAQGGHQDIVVALLAHGANADAKGPFSRTALHYAAHYGHLAVVRELLDFGANIEAHDVDGSTPLHFAAGNGHQNVIEYLLSQKADLEATDNNGNTALRWAVVEEHSQCIEVLAIASIRLHGFSWLIKNPLTAELQGVCNEVTWLMRMPYVRLLEGCYDTPVGVYEIADLLLDEFTSRDICCYMYEQPEQDEDGDY